MFGLDMLDAFIGLITVYLTLSLIVTAIGEGVSQVLCFRGRILNLSIERLVGQDLAQDIFEHRRIQDLQKNQKRKPSYIPDWLFAEVLVDVVLEKRFAELRSQPGQLLSAFETKLKGGKPWQRTLLDFWRQSNTDIEVFLSKIAAWFNDTGDRAVGWFKRQLGWLTFFAGFVVAVGLNADTIHIYHTLTESSDLRKAYVERALQLAKNNETKSISEVCQTHGLGKELGKGDCTVLAVVKAEIPEVLPLVGWDESAPIRKELGKLQDQILGWLKSIQQDKAGPNTGNRMGQGKENLDPTVLLLSFFGWILTAFALSLGAPFWFDLLQKLVQVRSSLKTEPTTGTDTASSGVRERGEDRRKEAERTKTDVAVGSLLRATPAGLAPESLERFDSFQSRHVGLSVINALWLARFSSLAYSEREAIEAQAAQWGAEAHFGQHQDTQWLLARDPRAAVLAFRGTEPDRIVDVLTDIKIAPLAPPWGGVGNVHEGFATELEAAWREIQAQLHDLHVVRDQVPVWVCGHSLGGALALLTALRLLQPGLQDGTKGMLFGALYTYAQPRVGDSVFADHADRLLAGRYFRAVNNRDIVPTAPFAKS